MKKNAHDRCYGGAAVWGVRGGSGWWSWAVKSCRAFFFGKISAELFDPANTGVLNASLRELCEPIEAHVSACRYFSAGLGCLLEQGHGLVV